MATTAGLVKDVKSVRRQALLNKVGLKELRDLVSKIVSENNLTVSVEQPAQGKEGTDDGESSPKEKTGEKTDKNTESVSGSDVQDNPSGSETEF